MALRVRHYTEEQREKRRQYDREYSRTRGYEDQKAWREANPEKWADINRRSMLKRRYGITTEQYDAMLARQGERCAICWQECKTGRRLAVDHDHETMTVRGLLCSSCNQGLGNFADSPDLLEAAARYLHDTDLEV